MNMNIFIVMNLLFFKHFIVDFILQTPFQYKNKGTYGHPGGLIHAFLHGITTYCILIFSYHEMAAILAFFDMFIHYHVDWAKMNLNKHWNLEPSKNESFWWMLGLDQYLHSLTYIGILYFLSGK